MVLRYADDEPADTDDIVRTLREHPSVSHVAIVHSETTTGLLNPAADIGKAIHAHNPEITYLVDMMSSFGAIHLDPVENHIHYLISSSNKMLQGVPGFAFVLAKLAKLRQTKGNARSLALDLYDQWDYQVSNPGQFRFTPPTHVLSAFYQAMLEFEAEGGVSARGKRYFNNQRVVSEMMQKMGFKLYINPKHQGCVITTFLEPKHPRFNFKTLYDYLAANNIVIYPGKLPKVPSFRIGNIGDLNEADMRQCMSMISEAFNYMGIELPLRGQ
jgi:2-aminoethylphosphonate-pyruvate transaminase